MVHGHPEGAMDDIPPLSIVEGGIVDDRVYELTRRGIEVAEAIINIADNEDEFNYYLADISTQNLVDLVNDPGMAKNMALLDSGTVHSLQALAVACYDFLGESAETDARAYLSAQQPKSKDEAFTAILRHSFSALQTAVFVGPNNDGGHGPTKEAKLRPFIYDFASVFASMYCNLNAIGAHVAVAPSEQTYFENNIKMATPLPPRRRPGGF